VPRDAFVANATAIALAIDLRVVAILLLALGVYMLARRG